MNTMRHILATAFVSLALSSFAGDCPALSGHFTIGKNDADFNSINDAVAALNCGGVSGPVTFQMENTYDERVVIGSIPGASAINTVTFASASGATISYSTSDATLVINDASFISFDNINIDHKTATYGNCMRVTGKSNNLRFKSVVFDGVESARSGANSATIYFASDVPKSDISFEDCEINNGSAGIYKGGADANNRDTRTSITGTLFFNQYESGLVLVNEDAPVITNNVFSSLSGYTNFRAISLDNISNNEIISNNIVNAANGTIGLAMNNCSAQTTNFGQVSNNSIAVGGDKKSYGIYMTGATDNQLINFNRVKLTMKRSEADQAFYKNAGSGNNINLMNCMFYNLNSGGYTIVGNTYKDAFNQLPSQGMLTASANGLMIEKVSPIK